MRKYHLILSDSSERDVRAENIRVTEGGGTLLFLNGTEVIAAYSADAWSMVEVERLDDKG
jgi:hypothetical protein